MQRPTADKIFTTDDAYVELNRVVRENLESHQTAASAITVVAQFGLNLVGTAFGILATIGTGFGIVPAIASELGCDKLEPVRKFSAKQIKSADHLLSSPYMRLLNTIHSKDDGGAIDRNTQIIQAKEYSEGLLAAKVKGVFGQAVQHCLNDNSSFIKQKVATRALYLLMLPTVLVARGVDLLVAPFAALAGIVTRGRHQRINSIAYRSLQAPGGAVSDTFRTITLIVDPSTREKMTSTKEVEGLEIRETVNSDRQRNVQRVGSGKSGNQLPWSGVVNSITSFVSLFFSGGSSGSDPSEKKDR